MHNGEWKSYIFRFATRNFVSADVVGIQRVFRVVDKETFQVMNGSQIGAKPYKIEGAQKGSPGNPGELFSDSGDRII